MDKQGVLCEKSGMVRARFEAGCVAAEEKPTANHVHCPNDYGGAGGVGQPFAVVGELAAQGTDGEGGGDTIDASLVQKRNGAKRMQSCGKLLQFGFGGEGVAELFDLRGCLIHHCPPVYDINQASRDDVRFGSQSTEPYCYDRCFAQTGGYYGGLRNIISNEFLIECVLPWKGRNAGESLKDFWKVLPMHGGVRLCWHGVAGSRLASEIRWICV